MRYGWIALILFITSISSANTNNCDEIKSEQLRLAMLGSNLSNINTTRTPEGGPYRPFQINSCINGTCDVHRNKSPLLKYLPDHPDADKNGYVAYPYIDKVADYTTFNLTAAKLRLLGNTKPCVESVIDNGTSLLLKYSIKNTGIKEDIFNFDSKQRVVSWMRTNKKGKTSAISFSSKGDIVTHQ